MVGMGTLVQLVATNIMLCSQWPCTYMRVGAALYSSNNNSTNKKTLRPDGPWNPWKLIFQ